ncbi:hypothetical protein BAY1663_04692 [Pseudomonas sp. BAY1663]|nr:hypothetical protein BAY1663_04692 [Pseudomonas sp. BAY1663]
MLLPVRPTICRPLAVSPSARAAASAVRWAFRATSWTLAAIWLIAVATLSVSCCWREALCVLPCIAASSSRAWLLSRPLESAMRPTMAAASVSSIFMAKAISPISSRRPV